MCNFKNLDKNELEDQYKWKILTQEEWSNLLKNLNNIKEELNDITRTAY